MTTTNLPPNSNAGSEAALLRSIGQLGQNITNSNLQASKTVNSIDSLVSKINDLTDFVGGLTKSFGRADKLQVDSLAIGSDLSTFLDTNNKALSKMQGSDFNNAGDLLKNYSFGLRENSDSMNDLMVRMRLSGQSTDVLRKAMGQVVLTTGGSIASVDDLIKENKNLSKTYGISSQSLLEAITELKPESERLGFMGAGKEFASLQQGLKAVSKELGEENVSKVLKFLVDPSKFAARIAMGLENVMDQTLESGISEQERISRFMAGISTFNKNVKSMTDNGIGSKDLKNFTNSMVLQGLGIEDIAYTASNLESHMLQQIRLGNEAGATGASILDSNKAFQEKITDFYDHTMSYLYPVITATLPIIAAGALFKSTVGAMSMTVASVAAIRTSLPLLGRVVGLLGPIGVAAGVVMTALPYLMKDNADSAAETAQNTADLLRLEKNKTGAGKATPESNESAIMSWISELNSAKKGGRDDQEFKGKLLTVLGLINESMNKSPLTKWNSGP